MSIDVQEYLEENGASPYGEWFESLKPDAAAKITISKIRISEGKTSNIKWFDGIGEYKIDWGPGYRIYLAKDGDKLLFCLVEVLKRANKRILRKQKNYGKSIKSAS